MQGLTSIYVIIRRIIRCASWWFKFKSLSELNSSSLLSPMASLSDISVPNALIEMIHTHYTTATRTKYCANKLTAHAATFTTTSHSVWHTHPRHKLQNGVMFIGTPSAMWNLLTHCNVLYHCASWWWALTMFCSKASVVGGRVHNFGAIFDLPILSAHSHWRHWVIEEQ